MTLRFNRPPTAQPLQTVVYPKSDVCHADPPLEVLPTSTSIDV
jgi:hypothetical protein